MMKFKADATAEQRHAAIEHVGTLRERIPEIVDYAVGFDAGLRDDNYDLAAVGDFATKADYEVYASHPYHLDVIQNYLAPILEARAAVQFEF